MFVTGRSGLETILGRVLSNQSMAGLVVSGARNRLVSHVAKIPIGVATNGCDEWGDAHACCTLLPYVS